MVISVSIIIPVYNAEAYVLGCLSSIQAQTIEDWECVCVDDGSSDQSRNIVESFVKEDSRFRLIEQRNGGPGVARNTGIIESRGTYFTFVDADDLIHPKMLETLLNLAKEHSADLVVADFFRFKSDTEFAERTRAAESAQEEAVVLGAPLLRFLSDWRKFRPESCAKLYLRTQHGHLRFPSLYGAEDLYVSYDAFACCRRAVFLAMPLYGYRVVSTGLTHSSSRYCNYFLGLPLAIRHGEDVLRRHQVSSAVRAAVAKGWVKLIFSLVNEMSVDPKLTKRQKKDLLSVAAKGLQEIRSSVAGQYRVVALAHFVQCMALSLGSLRLLLVWQCVRRVAFSRLKKKHPPVAADIAMQDS